MNKKIIVTIGREFCSGGMEVGKKLAEKLGISFYDKELISLAAKKSGFIENIFENADEKPTNSFLYSIAMGVPSATGMLLQNTDFLTNDKLFSIQSEVIKNIAKEGPCVLIGRCSNYILREEENLVSIYLHADMDFRIKRLLEVEKKDVSLKDAESFINKADKKRASYYRYYTGKEWNWATNYDLCLDTSKMGIENTVEQIYNYIKIILEKDK